AVRQQDVGLADHLVEQPCLRLRVELRVAQHGAQLGHLLGRGDEVRQLLAHLGQAALVPGGLEQRLGVDAVGDGYEGAPSRSRTEKSSSRMASSIRRRWSE